MTENFGARLKFVRTSRKLTEAELANKAGIKPATVKRIERRGIRPPLDLAKRLAHALDIPTALLLGTEVEQ